MNQNNPMRKSPGLAGFLSIMPGAGQIYVGYYLSGFTNVFVIGAIISVLESGSVRELEPFFGMFLAFFWIFNIVDAVRKANLYNLNAMGAQERDVPTDSPLVGGVVLVLIGFLLTLDITFGVDLEWIEEVWPLAILGVGIYLLWKYRKTKAELAHRGPGSWSEPPPPATPPRPGGAWSAPPPAPPERSGAPSGSGDRSPDAATDTGTGSPSRTEPPRSTSETRTAAQDGPASGPASGPARTSSAAGAPPFSSDRG